MLRRARANVERAGRRDRIALARGRAEQLPFPDASFDAVTFTYLLRYVADPKATVRELARVLRPGAPMASLDFFVPPNPVFRAVWWIYTRTLLPVGGLLGGRAWVGVGRFLGPNISAHTRRYPREALVAAWEEAGMTDVEAQVMSFGAGLVMWGRRAGD
jgi:demethylmenaquinone methyltransferase/2-methoxy-6-polyprenyl-1,4-benzoquinol methylase